MGMTKNYLNNLLCACAPTNGFAQDAIEHAIIQGRILLTMNLEADVRAIMARYDDLIEDYRNTLNENQQALWASYQPMIQKLGAA